MLCSLRFVLVAAPLLGGCAQVPFEKRTTPSGDPCTDMPIIPGGHAVDRPYHRLGPIASDPKATTEAERLWSLRQIACEKKADAVIEATNEEVRVPEGTGYLTRASGTAIVWTQAPARPRPVGSSDR